MFVTTLPILFAFTNLVSPLELCIILLAILLAVYGLIPSIFENEACDPYTSFYLYLHAAWLGRMDLGRVFWPFLLLINSIFFYIDYRIENDTYTISSWKTVHSMVFLPIVWWVVAVWQCSGQTQSQSKYWASAARAVTIYLLFDFLLRMIISYKFPQLLFDCKLLTIEFGDC